MSEPTNVPLGPASVESLHQGLTHVSLLCTTLAVAFCTVVLRILIRVAWGKLGSDDYLVIVAWVVACFGAVANINMTSNGIGRHMNHMTLEELSGFKKWALITEIQFIISTSLTKISFCFFILRLLDRVKQRSRQFIHGLIIFVVLTGLGLVIAFLLKCRPVRKFYDPSVPGTCYSQQLLYGFSYAQCAVSIITDFSCVLIPIFVLSKLRIKRTQKIAISLVFGLGIFTASCSIFRTAILYQNFHRDLTHINNANHIFFILEENIGIVATSLPILRPIISRVIPISRESGKTSGPEITEKKGSLRSSMQHFLDSEEGDVPLYPMSITRTTTFKVERDV